MNKRRLKKARKKACGDLWGQSIFSLKRSRKSYLRADVWGLPPLVDPIELARRFHEETSKAQDKPHWTVLSAYQVKLLQDLADQSTIKP